MLEFILLALASTAGSVATNPLPCLPAPSHQSRPTPSAIKDHRALREALGEPMPATPSMVMLYGKGGHLSTQEYSIIVGRAANGTWKGTAVGRSQIWVTDAPYSPMKRVAWTLDKATGEQLDYAISHHCPVKRKSPPAANPGPPPLGYIGERIDVLTSGRPRLTFYADEDDEKIAALIRPPK